MSISENTILLIECTQQYISERSEVGDVEIKKLLHVMQRFKQEGLSVVAMLVCGEEYGSNKTYFDGKLREDVYIMFNEGLKRAQTDLNMIKSQSDILNYAKTKGNSLTIY